MKYPTLSLRINNRLIDALVDTGSSVNIPPPELVFDQIFKTNKILYTADKKY